MRWDDSYTLDEASFSLLEILETHPAVGYLDAYERMKSIFPKEIDEKKFDYLVSALHKSGYLTLEDEESKRVFILRTDVGSEAYGHNKGKYGKKSPIVKMDVDERFFGCPKCGEQRMSATGGSELCRNCGHSKSAD